MAGMITEIEVRKALREVESRLAWGDKLGAVFSGISLGSILLLVALGLAITYGLMQLVYGPLGDRYGKARVITWVCALCTLAAFAAAMAPTLQTLGESSDSPRNQRAMSI